MRRIRAIADLLSLVSLSLWLGVVVMSGLVAAVAFPAMKALNPSIPAYAAYPNDHWSIAAGAIARRVFDLGAGTQWALAGACGAAIALSIAASPALPRRTWQAGRLVTFALALGTLALWRFWLAPGMDDHLDAFLAAAKAGDTAVADEHRQAFSADHPLSARLLSLLAVFLLAAAFETGRWILVSRCDTDADR